MSITSLITRGVINHGGTGRIQLQPPTRIHKFDAEIAEKREKREFPERKKNPAKFSPSERAIRLCAAKDFVHSASQAGGTKARNWIQGFWQLPEKGAPVLFLFSRSITACVNSPLTRWREGGSPQHPPWLFDVHSPALPCDFGAGLAFEI